MGQAAVPEIVYLTNSMPWFGSHTGYERLNTHLDPKQVSVNVVHPHRGFAYNAFGKLYSTFRGHGSIAQDEACARAVSEIRMRLNPRAVAHLVYGDMHLPFWRDVPKRILDRSLVTLHQPQCQWEEPFIHSLKSYRHALVLWQKEMDWFQSLMPDGEVSFLHHGVDIDWFSPLPPANPPEKYRLLYAGVHLRNTAMLGRVVRALAKRRMDIHFDFLVPVGRRNERELAALVDHPNVSWHANLDDAQLRDLYRQSFLMVLPMDDSGANTAVVESISCGLPLVTTDVGGIRDYGGGVDFPVVANNDDAAMIDLIESYVSHPTSRDEASARCRKFAETTLAWPLIAQKHIELYRKIGG